MSDNYQFEEEEFSTQFNGQTALRLLAQLKPHWPHAVGLVLLIIGVSALESYFTFLGKRIIDEGIIPGNRDALINIATIYGSLILIQAICVCGFITITGFLGEKVRLELRRTMFNHLQNLSLSYYNKTPVGWIISRVTSDTDRVAELITWGLLDIMWGIANIGTAVCFMLYINWKLGLIVLMIIPIIVAVAIQFKKRIIVEFRMVRKINSKITGSFNEMITGVRVVKALRREEASLGEFGLLSGEMYRAGYRAAWLSALFLPTVQIISAVAVGSIVWYGGLQAEIGALTIGGIQAFVSYVTFMVWPIEELARVYASMQQAIASGERIFSLIDAVPQIVDKDKTVAVDTLRHDIQFENVSFWYEEDEQVLENFNLHVKQGETIALVGPTGGGKSTIVNLVGRFFEPSKGVIRIGEHDYTDYTQHGIQSRIGIVLQTPHLFSGTVGDNLRYGKLDATDAEIEEAAKIVGAHEFIQQLEKGYATEVGEGGNSLSVGQKQLISLARAILAQPDIFIMDEATSSVDTLTETLIQQGMDALMHDRTSFVIAHRLSTIRSADRILVIENGHIAEMGSHDELLEKRGHYYRLYSQQFRETELDEADFEALVLDESISDVDETVAEVEVEMAQWAENELNLVIANS